MQHESFLRKHILLLILPTVLIGLCFLMAGPTLFPESDAFSTIMRNVIEHIIPAGIFYYIIRRFQLNYSSSAGRQYTKLGCIMGFIVVLLFVVLQVIYSWGHLELDNYKDFGQILLVLFDTLCIGLFEELMLRGVVFQAMQQKWQGRKNSILYAAILSSALFGCLHLINLIARPQLIYTTISQVIYATFLGICFCGLYYKTQNLWIPIITHALIDFSCNILITLSSWYAHQAAVDVPLLEAIIQTVLVSPTVLIGVWCIISTSSSDNTSTSKSK